MNKTKYQMVYELLQKLNASELAEVTSIYDQVFDDSTPDKDANGIVVAEEVSALFEGTDITEELKSQTIAIFEVAVAEKVSAQMAGLEDNICVATDSALEDLKEAQEENISRKRGRYKNQDDILN
ncbi:MAG: hypothetical protein L3J58_12465 [Emcibacter sp.]|nr:hypothetical protein [Emcibacter sp.]